MIRAKFTCTAERITTSNGERLSTFEFMPVTTGSEENKEFFKWTPTGKLDLGTVNPNVSFEVGKEYYLDFTPVAA